MANPSGQIVDTSHSGGLRVAEMWCFLFRENEIAVREGRWTDVLDDDDLASRMLLAFPDRWESKVLRLVGRVRWRYNTGRLTHGGIPIVRSHRYRRVGKEVWLCTNRGRALTKLGEGDVNPEIFERMAGESDDR